MSRPGGFGGLNFPSFGQPVTGNFPKPAGGGAGMEPKSTAIKGFAPGGCCIPGIPQGPFSQDRSNQISFGTGGARGIFKF